ncbi:hypothetical protein AB0J42_28280 [Nonomuraea sp. NPDC049649]|uniref:hypothetical protein n=1 Tax=Nonomuraea sp. NPDC049649 TaxID=3155776 RepID=UPI00342F36FA
MTMIPLIIAGVIGVALLVGYVAVLVGIRREDKRLSLRKNPDGASAALARRVTGCYVRGGVLWT